jgi:transcriptional regulator with XRE-family HTH domain
MAENEVLEKIKTLRLLKGYTQEYMATRLEMDPSNYGRIERGEAKLTLERFLKICQILDESPSYFLGESESVDNEAVKYLKKIYRVVLEILENVKKTKNI